mgnify:FL=1
MTISQANKVAKAIEAIASVAEESSTQAIFESLCDSGIFHKDDECEMIEEALDI